MHAQSLQSCLTLCDPTDCSLPGSSVHGVLQARILGSVAMSYVAGGFFTAESLGKPLLNIVTGIYTQVLLCSRLDLHRDMRRSLLPSVAYHFMHAYSVTSAISDCL